MVFTIGNFHVYLRKNMYSVIVLETLDGLSWFIFLLNSMTALLIVYLIALLD